MEKIKFLTDSGSDITLEEENAHENLSVLNFRVTLGDLDFVSRVGMTTEQFYKALSETDEIPKTAQLTVFEFAKAYAKAYNEGYTHILVTLINSEGSATFGNSVAAKDRFFKEHPEAAGRLTIVNIDSRSYTGGYGYPVKEAVKMAEEGRPFSEIVAYVQDVIDHLVIYFAPYTLKYARKSGRIPGAVAVVGEALGIKPVMRICDHRIVNDEMVRGEKKLIPKIAEKTLTEIEPGSPYNIVHGIGTGEGQAMAAEMTRRMGYPPAGTFQINPIVASHSGPRVVGVIFRSLKAVGRPG